MAGASLLTRGVTGKSALSDLFAKAGKCQASLLRSAQPPELRPRAHEWEPGLAPKEKPRLATEFRASGGSLGETKDATGAVQ